VKFRTLYLIFAGLFILFQINTGYSQLTFQKTYGGPGNDAAEAIHAITGGGYIISGNTQSYGTLGAGGNFNEDNKDMFTVKCDLAGQIQWSRTSGIINNREEGRFVASTTDGGFLVGGRTYDNSFKDDWYLQKFDATGTGVFNTNFGMLTSLADWDDELFKAQQITPSGTPGENFGMAGWTMNYRIADDRDMTFGIYNTTTSSLVANLHFGTTAGTITESARDFIEESPTSYSMFGWSDGFAGGAGRNFMLVRMTYTPPVIIPPTPASLAVSSYKSFGGNGADEATSYFKTSDGGYIMCGFTTSFGSGGNDIFLIKVSAPPAMTVEWSRAIGGTGDDRGYMVKQLSDGTYIVVGTTNSYGAGNNDMIAVKLNSSGNLSWAKCYGSTGSDEGRSMAVRTDGGFYFAGWCDPPISAANRDMYVVSTNATGYSGGCNETTITPTVTVVPIGSILTSTTGGASSGVAINRFAKGYSTTSPAATLTCRCTNFLPNKEITGATQVCRNSTNVNYYFNPIPGITNYTWSITGGTFATAPAATDTSVNVNFTNTNVQIIVSAFLSPAACNFAIDTINITVDQIATAINTTDSLLCVGQSTTLNVNTVNNIGGVTYVWNPVLPSPSASEVVTPGSTTTYTVTVTDGLTCTATDTIRVAVFPYPVVNLGANDTVCNGGPVLLNATTAGGTYLWNTTATSATINAPTTGTYWVDVTTNGCTTRDSIILGISSGPTINIAGDDSICIGQNTILTANPSGGIGPYNYLWSGGLGTANNINVSPVINTTYTVTITESFGCTNTATQLVNVFTYPVINIGPNDTVCNGGPVLLNATTASSSYLWNTSATTATINAATSGIYWVDVDRFGCVTRDSIILGISTNPIIDITGDDSLCLGENTILTANPSSGTVPYSYLWSGGLGTANNINVSPNVNTTYTVTVTEAFGCTNTETLLVNVFNYPIVDLGPDSGICNGVVPFVLLDAQNPGAGFNWSTSAITQTINVNTSGLYWVDVATNGCTTRDSVQITFSTTPTSGFTGITTICEGFSTTLTGNGTGGTSPYTYTWSDGPTIANTITLSPGINTNYSIITADLAGCSDTAFFTITVNPNPIVNLGPDTVGCLNAPITLFAPITSGTILWSTGSSATSITVPTAGTIWLDITETGCTTRDSVNIGYFPIPNVNLGPDTVICSIQNITLDATNIFSTYLWSTSATTPTINVGQTNLYWVNVTSCGITYTDSISVFIDTFSLYVVSLVPNDCGSSNGGLTVGTNSIYPSTYLWTSGISGTNPVLTNISDGVYIVEATDSVGCKKTLNIPVVCTTPTIVITQLVTPNADGKNDTWIIQGINNFPQAKVIVYNRWGNEVYNSSPYNNDWDGKSNSGISLGNDYLPAGTYYYVVDVYGDGTDVKSGYLEFQP
jgi:gliding motility-associated-like protein